MRFEELLSLVGGEPLFETGFLLAGESDASEVRRQLSRWVRSGKVVQLRRGLYALAEPFRKVEPHPFLVSNRLFRGSYVSREAALAHHGLVPEAVHVVTAAGGGRPERLETPLGHYDLRHLQPRLLRGFRGEEVSPGQSAFVATPEKALLDLVYLSDGGDSAGFLGGLRLQNLGKLDLAELERAASHFGTPKMARAVRAIGALVLEESVEYRDL